MKKKKPPPPPPSPHNTSWDIHGLLNTYTCTTSNFDVIIYEGIYLIQGK